LHHVLKRVDLRDRRVSEDFLQDALSRTPQILPVEEIDQTFSPLVSLGREIVSIDNLFISPTGKITLVETKLWRNPQAIREVVGQILDYATKITLWSYTEFESAIRSGLPPIPLMKSSLYDYVAGKYPQDVLPEAQFIDEVQKNLRTGHFLLLVVGDGIRESIENMLEQLHKHPQLLFTFGLVEIQIFEIPDLLNGRLLIPMLVARTTEVVRAVVRVQTTGQAQVSVEIEETPRVGRRTLSEEIFFEEVKDAEARALFKKLLAFVDEIGAVPVWRASSVAIRLPDPKGSGNKLTLFLLTTTGDIYTGWLADQLNRISMPKQIAYEYAKSICSLFLNVQPKANSPSDLSRYLHASEVAARSDDFMEIVRKTVERIKTDGK
jgi:hypothetical protein